MRVLAVETSTLSGGAALLDGELVVGEYVLDVRLTHSERLMAAIDRLLTDAGWTVGELEGLAVAVGPGSFTGHRQGSGAGPLHPDRGRADARRDGGDAAVCRVAHLSRPRCP